MMLTTILLVLFPVLAVGCYSLLYCKRKALFFLKRNESAILVASLAGWLAYTTLVASAFNNIITCGVIYIASSLVAPLSASPQLLRAFSLRGRFESAKLVIEEEISSREQRKKGLATIPSGGEYRGDDNKSATAPANLVSVAHKKESDIAIERFRNRVNTTKWATAILLSIILIVAWSLSSIESGQTDFHDCKKEPGYFSYAKLLLDVASILMAVTACVLVRNIDDELYLNYEITETSVLFIITSIIIIPIRLEGLTGIQPVLQTVQQMVLLCSMIILPCCPENKAMESIRSWFKQRINPALKSAVPGYAQPLPHYHRGSSVRNSIQLPNKNTPATQVSQRMTLETNTSWDAGLAILLSSEEGINAFTRHCAREFSSENILFWCAVNEYRTKFDDDKKSSTTATGDDIEHKNDPSNNVVCVEVCERSIVEEGHDIYNRFIDNHSISQINLSSKQRGDIKAAVDSGCFTKDTFDTAQKEIFSVMSRDSYPRFIASKRNRKPI